MGLMLQSIRIFASIHDQDLDLEIQEGGSPGAVVKLPAWKVGDRGFEPALSSHISHHPQDILLVQFILHVHKGGIKPHSFNYVLMKHEITAH